jgi:hypothetical protein
MHFKKFHETATINYIASFSICFIVEPQVDLIYVETCLINRLYCLTKRVVLRLTVILLVLVNQTYVREYKMSITEYTM